MADEKIIIGISTEVDKSELDKAFKEVGKQVNKFNESDDLQIKIDTAISKLEDAKGITELKRNLKDLKGLALEVGDSNSKEFKRITDAIGQTNDKIGDLNSAIQSSSGEPIENLSKSFRGVGDSVRSLDFKSARVQFNILTGSVKDVTNDLFGGIFALKSYRTATAEGATTTEALSIATKGFGKALAATGIGLIVIAVAALIANFETLKTSGGLLGKIFTKIGETIDFVREKLKAFSDALGLTDFAGQKQTEDLLKNLKKQETAITESYDRIIAQKESEGKDTNRFEAGKTDALIKNLQEQEKALRKSFGDKKVLSDEEQGQLDEVQSKVKSLQSERVILDNEYRKHQSELIEQRKKEQQKLSIFEQELLNKTLKDGLNVLDETLKAEKKLKDDAVAQDEARRKEDADKRAAQAEADGRRMFEIDRRNADAKFNMSMADKDKEYAALSEKLKKSGFDGIEIINQQQVLLDEIYEAQKQKELSREDLTLFEKGEINQKYDNLKEQNKKDTEKRITDFEIAQLNMRFDTALRVTDSINALSDLVFTIKSNNLEKGTDEERRVAKEQFEFNKKLQIAVAVISGIQGVINTITAKSVIPEPFGTIQKVATAVTIAASTAANIAKISAQQFDGGKQTPNSPPPAPKPTPTQIGAGTSATIGRAQLKTRQDGLDYIKVNVTETDIRRVSTRVEVVENRSRIR